jgi:(p)ppGpp synthase/HD superfamily hydrolase
VLHARASRRDPRVRHQGRGSLGAPQDCTNAASLKAQPEKLLEVEWAPTAQSTYLVNIQVEALGPHRLLSDITMALSTPT